MIPELKKSAALLAACGLLAAGCKTWTATAQSPRSDPPELLQFLRRLVGVESKVVPEKLPVEALAHYAEGVSHDADKEYDQALESYRKAALADPSYEPLVMEVARRSLVSGNTESAIEVLLKAAQFPSASASVHAWLAVAYGQDGKGQLAAAQAQKALAKVPTTILGFQNLAQIYLENNRVTNALEVLDQASRVVNNDPGELIDLAELYSQIGRWNSQEGDSTKERVKRILDRAASLNPKSPPLLEKMGDRYFLIEEYEKSAQAYARLLDATPNLPLVRARLIDIYDQLKQFDKVYEQLETIAKDDPKDPQPFLMLGSLAMEQATEKNVPGDRAKEKLQAATRYFEKVVVIAPGFEPVYYSLASAHLKLGGAEPAAEALKVLDQAKSRFRTTPATAPVIELYTAFAHQRINNEKEAADHYTAAYAAVRALRGISNEFNYWIGEQNEQFGDIETAGRYFRKSLAIDPNSPEINNNIGYIWADHGTNLQEAKVLIERAVAAKPNEAMYLDSLAWVLFKLNQPKEAMTWMQKAIDNLEGPDATIFDHLGDISAALKDFAKAKDAYTKSLAVEPSDEIKKKLDRLPLLPNSSKSP